jgi:CRP-like cAMP-binding protein
MSQSSKLSQLQFEPLPPVPAVSLARKLKLIPVFRNASVDELFRISEIARQVRYPASALVSERGAPAEYIQILLQGEFGVDGGARKLAPPAMLGFEEVLRGTTLQESASAAVESVALVMPAEDFRGLLSANIELAQGLFRTLLDPSRSGPGSEGVSIGKRSPAFRYQERGEPLKTVEKALLLQTIPIFSRATGEEIYEVAAIARETGRENGSTLLQPGKEAAIVLVLAGAIRLSSPEGELSTVSPGESLGVRETLAGSPWPVTATVAGAGRFLQLDREPLFDLLADRLDLLHGVFTAIFLDREGEPLR